MQMIESTLLFTIAYLLGSISFAIVVARLYGLPDPRSHGSGNPGATNMLRTGKKSAAVITLIGDALKGSVAVWLAQWVSSAYGLPPFTPYVAALAAFLGHLFPVFFGFKGGKGVATAVGVLLALDVQVGGLVILVWASVFAVTRVSSLSALLATALLPLFAWLLLGTGIETALLSVLAVLVLIRHHSNIRRLISGEETAFKRR